MSHYLEIVDEDFAFCKRADECKINDERAEFGDDVLFCCKCKDGFVCCGCDDECADETECTRFRHKAEKTITGDNNEKTNE